MQNFSEIADKIVTPKDNLINEVVFDSGLDRSLVGKLYEDYELFNRNPTEEFTNLLAPKNGFYNPNQFFEALKASNVTLEETPKLTNEILFSFNNLAQDITVSAPILFKVIANILKKKNSKFEKVISAYDPDGADSYEDSTLFESSSIVDKQEAFDNTKKLYEGLRDILSRNDSKWGYSYHLENAYDAIMNYLQNEITSLSTENDIVSINDTFHDQLIKDLITSTINPMYRDVNVLKTLVPDIQTLVFDMVVLIHTFIIENSNHMAYASRDTYNKYLHDVEEVYKAISSSRVTSHVLYQNSDDLRKMKEEEPEKIYEPTHKFILDELRIDYTKLQLCGDYRLQFKNVIDMIYIVKSCSFEFNLKIRPRLRNYITHTIELMGQAEKVILEASKINKYKNW